MPQIGDHDVFEQSYVNELRSLLSPHGLLIKYDLDRAALDLGFQPYEMGSKGKSTISQVRVWVQAKGLHAQTFSADDWTKATDVGVASLSVEYVKFWYASAEPVYLVVFLESVSKFLAADVRDLVDNIGGLPLLSSLGDQQTMTLHLPTTATLEAALASMPRHRSMRIDGPPFRGRPLGHRYDPLRSELRTLGPTDYVKLVDALLDVHRFRPVQTQHLTDGLRVQRGTLHHAYEWVLPMTTELGFDEHSDYRHEGRPLHAQGGVLIMVDSFGQGTHGLDTEIRRITQQAYSDGAEKVLVFMNTPESQLINFFAKWRLLAEPLRCAPQAMGSLTFNVLTTTTVFLDLAQELSFQYVNYS